MFALRFREFLPGTGVYQDNNIACDRYSVFTDNEKGTVVVSSQRNDVPFFCIYLVPEKAEREGPSLCFVMNEEGKTIDTLSGIDEQG